MIKNKIYDTRLPGDAGQTYANRVRRAHVCYLLTCYLGELSGGYDNEKTDHDNQRMSAYEQAVIDEMRAFVIIAKTDDFINGWRALEASPADVLDLYRCYDTTGCRGCVGKTESLCDPCSRMLFRMREIFDSFLAMRRCVMLKAPNDVFMFADRILCALRVLAVEMENHGAVRLSL
jgi:hypothetical protein